jgi:metallo-beta-lactamase family protein
MKVKFCGGAGGSVTGSSHLITLSSGYKILLDCGLYQGNEEELDHFNTSWLFDPATIDVMILSHAHIDHTGRIPKLVKDGFKGQIICTSATRDLSLIMLMDSALIQQKDAEHKNKKKKDNEPLIRPLYETIDAKNALDNFVSIPYSKWHTINSFLAVKLEDAGHIIGSASVVLKIVENGQEKVFGFSGDIGRPDRPILKDPRPIDAVDYLICESTYGGKKHQGVPQDKEDFLKVVLDTCVTKKGKLLIPAFSVGRTQELVYMLDQLSTEGKLPAVKVYVDSPLAVNATDIFRMHPECYDEQMMTYVLKDPNPFGFNNIIYVQSSEDSKRINSNNEPCVIIASSGMMNAGRIVHHINNNIENRSTTLLVVGYCSPHTLGGKLMQKPKEVRIFGQTKQVNAEVVTMPSMSAHGDESEMLAFLGNQSPIQLKKIMLVHGEEEQRQAFKIALVGKGFNSVLLPDLGEEVEL